MIFSESLSFHDRQCSGDSVQDTANVHIDYAVLLVDLEQSNARNSAFPPSLRIASATVFKRSVRRAPRTARARLSVPKVVR